MAKKKKQEIEKSKRIMTPHELFYRALLALDWDLLEDYAIDRDIFTDRCHQLFAEAMKDIVYNLKQLEDVKLKDVFSGVVARLDGDCQVVLHYEENIVTHCSIQFVPVKWTEHNELVEVYFVDNLNCVE